MKNVNKDNWVLGKINRLLCVRLDNFGDVIMCTPAFKALKDSLPGMELTLLTSEIGSKIAQMIPEIDRIISFQAPWIKSAHMYKNSRQLKEMIKKLKHFKFEASVIMTTYTQTPFPAAMMCFLAEIPKRLAFAHENPYQLIDPYFEDPEPAAQSWHEVRRQLELVGKVGCHTNNEKLSLIYPLDAAIHVSQLINQNINYLSKCYVINIGATAPSRRYPLRHYSRVIDIMDSKGWKAIITGAVDEINLSNELIDMNKTQMINLCGKLTLTDLAALIDITPLLITNNTGASHIAAALNTPVVVLYAQTNMQHFPWTENCRVLYHDVTCKNCFKSICPMGHHHCLELVDPEEVVRAAEEILNHRKKSHEQGLNQKDCNRNDYPKQMQGSCRNIVKN